MITVLINGAGPIYDDYHKGSNIVDLGTFTYGPNGFTGVNLLGENKTYLFSTYTEMYQIHREEISVPSDVIAVNDDNSGYTVKMIQYMMDEVNWDFIPTPIQPNDLIYQKKVLMKYLRSTNYGPRTQSVFDHYFIYNGHRIDTEGFQGSDLRDLCSYYTLTGSVPFGFTDNWWDINGEIVPFDERGWPGFLQTYLHNRLQASLGLQKMTNEMVNLDNWVQRNRLFRRQIPMVNNYYDNFLPEGWAPYWQNYPPFPDPYAPPPPPPDQVDSVHAPDPEV